MQIGDVNTENFLLSAKLTILAEKENNGDSLLSTDTKILASKNILIFLI